jgi:hypothetical protein
MPIFPVFLRATHTLCGAIAGGLLGRGYYLFKHLSRFECALPFPSSLASLPQ